MKISLIVYPENLSELPVIEKQTTDLAHAINAYWQPLKTWSGIILFLSESGTPLTLLVLALLPAISILYLIETRRQRKLNLRAYEKLSATTKALIEAVSLTEKTTKPTIQAISLTLHSRTGEAVDDEKLLQRLRDAEKIGMIKSAVSSTQDQPTQVWTSQVKPF
jgi:hypothetical protein